MAVVVGVGIQTPLLWQGQGRVQPQCWPSQWCPWEYGCVLTDTRVEELVARPLVLWWWGLGDATLEVVAGLGLLC